MEEHMKRVKAREMRNSINFYNELKQLRKNPDDAHLHSELSTFVSLNPKFSLKILNNVFEKVASETDNVINIIIYS